ncbi:phenylacetate--CoA ligase family protein [Amycolatopsis orientalis]|uniref:phenylacetate--CoA ligase family protein n=1 Tax=Amycolatopsis orientalis TaxID=31958 RepID=UPI000559E900|nr:phenylacetate--CoA ligase family protein [Amycolatopsis orientalis]
MTEKISWLRRDARRARKEARASGTAPLAQRQRERLADLVAYARAQSPYYAKLYQGLPDRVDDPALLPVTDKTTLTRHFDDWVTDRDVTFSAVTAFVDDPDRIGRRFLGKYSIATTSGTSGHRGVFALDERYQNVAGALGLVAYASLGAGPIAGMLARGFRLALVGATGGHYVSFAGYTQATRESAWRRRILRAFSVHLPMPELVARLNAYRPAAVIGYASVIRLLAAEQEAGRLRIRPALVQPAGDAMTTADTERIAAAFRTAVRPIYSCTECTYLSNGCAHGWYHVNSDWAVLEPVDAEFRPTPPGQVSHTVLLTNLANRVQPFLRYNLGDSVLPRPDPCPCGNPLPAVRVHGRAGDILSFPSGRGESVALAPMVFSTLFDRIPGVELFQVEQTAPTTLRIRLLLADGTEPEQVWQRIRSEAEGLLADNGLRSVALERAEEPPRQEPGGGKYRAVVPYR